MTPAEIYFSFCELLCFPWNHLAVTPNVSQHHRLAMWTDALTRHDRTSAADVPRSEWAVTGAPLVSRWPVHGVQGTVDQTQKDCMSLCICDFCKANRNSRFPWQCLVISAERQTNHNWFCLNLPAPTKLIVNVFRHISWNWNWKSTSKSNVATSFPRGC